MRAAKSDCRASAPLILENVEFSYNGAVALDGISLHVEPGEIVALLGSNGAGKTTTAKVIAGALRPKAGSLRFEDADISNLRAHEMSQRGIALVPEGRLVFAQMTIEDNLLMGAYREPKHRIVTERLEMNYQLFPRLRERRYQLAGSLSGGEQQMLAIGRGLMADPKLLVLDEPSLGIMPKLVHEIFTLIGQIASGGTSILLIEQNARASLEISSRAYVVEKGRIALSGPSRDLLESNFVRVAYLGADS
jgi:branched-chain amino acid transport system ATP-binding protein